MRGAARPPPPRLGHVALMPVPPAPRRRARDTSRSLRPCSAPAPPHQICVWHTSEDSELPLVCLQLDPLHPGEDASRDEGSDALNA